jgi:hypothetical protein
MPKKTSFYTKEILQALNLKDTTPRAIHSKDVIKVICSGCNFTTDERQFESLLRKFKSRWYSWLCKECSDRRRDYGVKKFWGNKENKEIAIRKHKNTMLEKYGVDNFKKIPANPESSGQTPKDLKPD